MISLLGPPELHKTVPQPSQSQPQGPQLPSADRFIDLLVADFNKMTVAATAPMGFTENASPTFLSSGNPCLDFFFHVVPNTPPHVLTHRLSSSWAHDPLTTLKLICNLRGVRGTGKSDNEGFYAAALWLHSLHPKTLACNVASFADFGYFKDLPEIIYRLIEGLDVRKIQKAEWMQRKGSGRRKSHEKRGYRVRRRGGRKQSLLPIDTNQERRGKEQN
ncbi:hypothetical protein Pint_23794 [Pistacia integerrima]|uniref:Uncharacterized protein n=1 Tax=Pistacia integerrima TaxID=434235 RepID=A0ACC0YP02_9ROSI|nr:hypothetical protein Pint_23794 [Pistacia integerrima]